MLCAFGPRKHSAQLNRRGFEAFNRRFEPARTRLDWLSRDESEVDACLADPLCIASFSNGLWRDLTGGLLEITSPGALRDIPKSLPKLIFGGELDPVGGNKGMTRLKQAFEDAGHDKITMKIYPGGRHEMLNETNREEVTADVLDWITQNL